MTDQELQTARQQLTERRDRILHRTNQRLAEISDELDSREIEPNENSAELRDAVRVTELSAVEHRMIAAIDDALERIDQGRYGTCAICGRPIEPARLAALPETTTCIEDATPVPRQSDAVRSTQ